MKINEGKKKRAGQTFLHGALILTIGMAIAKVVGALFKVPLNAVIGEYGMGLFNVAYNFYGPIHSLATAGLPIAVSRMVSESYSRGRYRDIRRIKQTSTPIFIGLGLTGTAVMLACAPYYCSNIIGNENAVLPMMLLAPAVLFGCLGSIYRGFNEGRKDMYPTAISEVIEAVSKLVIGLTAAVWISRYCANEYALHGSVLGRVMDSVDEAGLITLSCAAAGAIFGVTCGSLLSFLFLLIRHRWRGDGISPEMLQESPKPYKKKTIAKRLVLTAIPVAIGSVTLNVAGLIDTTFLQNRLLDIVHQSPGVLLSMYSGMIPDEYVRQPETIPNFLYGCYTLALTVYMLVPTITQAFSISALPNITELWIKGDRKEIKSGMESVVRITALFSLPAGIGISALSEPITKLLYGSNASTPIVSDILFVMGFAASLAAISTPVSSMLQAVGRADVPVKMLLAAMGIKVAVNYVLCGIPEINVMGAGIGTLCCYLFLVVFELIMLCRITGIRIDVASTFIRPIGAALLCGISAYIVSNLAGVLLEESRFSYMVVTVAGIAAGAVVYVLSLWIFNAIDRNDLAMLPKGQKIAKILEKR